VQKAALDTEEAVRAYKDLGHVEQAFRSYKTVDLKVRPIYHYLVDRVRAHVFLCMLAYYVEWHMRQALAPLLFDDDDKATAEAQRDSPVVPAKPSPSAQEGPHLPGDCELFVFLLERAPFLKRSSERCLVDQPGLAKQTVDVRKIPKNILAKGCAGQ